MSGINFLPAGFTLLEAAALDLLNPVLFIQRNIGGFVADITITEEHSDETVITEHPVEQGAEITDHSYLRPGTVTITAGWSNSSPGALGDPAYVQNIYAALLALRATRQPFNVVTGKRSYTNMLFKRISTTTDEKTENAMIITAELQEILIATTQTVTTPDSTNMANPSNNAGDVSRGSQNLVSDPPNFNSSALA